MSDVTNSEVKKFAATTVALFASWGLHDFLQEAVFRQPGFTYGLFMAFCLQTVAVLGASGTSLWKRRMKAGGEEYVKQETPNIVPREVTIDVIEETLPQTSKIYSFYALLAAVIAASNGLSTSALNYVNMPAKVLFKSSKLIPVMVISSCMGSESFSVLDYVCAAATCLGLAVFSFADVSSAAQFSIIGIGILAMAVFADALAPNIQQILLKNMKQSKEEVLYYTNWLSSIFTLFALGASGSLFPSLAYVSGNHTALGLLLLQSVAGYAGILTFLYSISEFGPSTTVLIASTRKMLTITVSYVVFNKPFHGFHVVGVATVMGAVTVQGYCKKRK